tara:strand:+ start:198 stop:1517 length:1320 start_codon:yes stop_codon:yes gene_type:complete
MGGGLLQLAAYGAQDLYLTGNPQMTFFIAVYKRHTNFAIESINQKFIGKNGFGNKVSCIIDRIGDLITNVFLDVKIPSLTDLEIDHTDQLVGWVNDLGFSLIHYAEVEIGGTVIDKHYGLWMGIWYELTTPKSKRYGGDILVGHDNFNDNDPKLRNGSYHLHIPLYFWFCRHEGLALPLIALQFHEVRINIKFRQLDELWQSLHGKFNQDLCNIICKDKYNIQSASLYVDYIYLENEERKLFVQRKHNYLIEQIQMNTEQFNSEQPNVRFTMDFCHPVKELIWVIHNEDVLTKNTTEVAVPKGNEWFNFSDRSYASYEDGPGGGNHPIDPLIEAELQIEGNQRFEKRDAQYFRLVQPFLRHTSTPEIFAYMYSFALHPENLQPSGTCNFSRIDSAVFHLKLMHNAAEKVYMTNPRITMFAMNYNVLQIASGMAGLAYMN